MSSSSSSNKLNFKTIQVKRLMKELADIEKFKQTSTTPPFTVELVNEKLDEWHVKVLTSSIDSSSELYVDLKKLKIPYILLHVEFPSSFPFLPPFIRVISPSIDKGKDQMFGVSFWRRGNNEMYLVWVSSLKLASAIEQTLGKQPEYFVNY